MTTPNEIPTPRTDAEAGVLLDANEEYAQTFDRCDGGEYVRSDFARTIERETIAQAKRIEELEKALIRCRVEMEKAQGSLAVLDDNNPRIARLAQICMEASALLNRQP